MVTLCGRNIAHIRDLSLTRDKIEQEILQTADKIVVYTKAEKEMVKKNYSDIFAPSEIDKKIALIPLGVDFQEINTKIRHQYRKCLRDYYLNNLSSTINFFMLGRVDVLKGQKEAIMAFSKALKECPSLNISLSIFGEVGCGEKNIEYNKEICKIVDKQPKYIKSRIMFHGICPTIHALAIGDIFLGPSKFEMWYLSANEASACSIPTILSDNKIMREIYGKGNCFVNPYDIDSIKNAMVKMATNNKYRQKIGYYNCKHTKKYTWKNSARQLRKVFETTLAQNQIGIN